MQSQTDLRGYKNVDCDLSIAHLPPLNPSEGAFAASWLEAVCALLVLTFSWLMVLSSRQDGNTALANNAVNCGSTSSCSPPPRHDTSCYAQAMTTICGRPSEARSTLSALCGCGWHRGGGCRSPFLCCCRWVGSWLLMRGEG